jgi:uncharacterized membrane protein YadS
VIACATWMAHRMHAQEAARLPGENGQDKPQRPPLLPGFVVVFVLLVVINSAGVLPKWSVASGNSFSQSFLVAAMVAIGMKTHLKDILGVGWKPVVLMVLETTFLAVLFYGLMRLFAIHA